MGLLQMVYSSREALFGEDESVRSLCEGVFRTKFQKNHFSVSPCQS
jgi:hypothetical protein